jgi:hypothetical protein
MILQESVVELVMEDIGLDGEGRVAITNPRVAEHLKIALATRRRSGPLDKPNTNCGCNVVAHCGDTIVNAVERCGAKVLRTEDLWTN